jgi:hypothetical protein
MTTDPTGTGVDVDAQIAAQVAAENSSLSNWAAAQQAASKASSANPAPDSSINWLYVGGAALAGLVILEIVRGR